MTDEADTDSNTDIAYLKPRSANWEPLNEGTYKSLKRTSDTPDEALSDLEQKELSKYKQQWSDSLQNSLQLPNLIFFAGSGTSLAEVGGPSMWDLWKKSMWVDPEALDDNFELKDQAVKTVDKVRYTESAKPNIEHFLSQCDAYLLFNEDEDVSTFMNEVKAVILNECSLFISGDGSDIFAYETLLQKLARRRVRDPRLKVFTTNYDMCFETSASNLGMMIIDGMSYTRQRRFDGLYFNYDVVKRDADTHEFVEGVIQLYKLHGSVSWERRDGDILEVDSPDPENAALIYPAKGKYQQAFVQPHLELMSRLIESLRQSNTCIIISGFGFNDDHISEPILSAIKSNPSLRLIVADYNAIKHHKGEFDETSPYWKKLFDLAESGYEISFVNASFRDLSLMIPNLRALSPAQQLANAVKEAGKS